MEIYSVIKNERTNNELVWKCPKEDFNTNTQLIVMESEEAVFIKDGIILQTFQGGKYTLNTDNYPFISKIRNMVSGGVNAFNCKVYFINKTHILELLWGTDSPIQIRDAKFGFAVNIRARGSYSIQISNSEEFLKKLVGMNIQTFTEENLRSQFRTVFQTKIKVAIANVITEKKYTVLDMNTQLENIADLVKEQMQEVMNEYGIEIVNFYVGDISIPEDDPNYKIINEAYAKANAGKIEIDIQGEDWERLSKKEIAKDIANNPNGGIASVGAGLGMGIATMGAFEKATKDVLQDNKTDNDKKIKCPKCNNLVSPNSNFCDKCGNKIEKNSFCHNCGKELTPESKFCSNCGAKKENENE